LISLYYCDILTDHVNYKHYFTVGSENGDTNSTYLQGIHAEGCCNCRDIPFAIKKYKEGALKKNRYCLNGLGFYYESIDPSLSTKYYNAAILAGSIEAMSNLGDNYMAKGQIDEMMELYNMAITKGGCIAAYNMASYYSMYKKDYAKMIEYATISADLGHLEAMYLLGDYYEKNSINYPLMEKYKLMSLTYKNNTRKLAIIKSLIDYYMRTAQYAKMKHYLLIAIKKKDVDSMYRLGDYYMKVEEKYELAMTYFEMAIKLGHSDSMVKLGIIYRVILENYKCMKHCFDMAVWKNNVEALYQLGDYYESIQNYKLMEKYYTMAVSRATPHEGAQSRLKAYHDKLQKKSNALAKKESEAFLEKHRAK
jgi:TPR repeat protein